MPEFPEFPETFGKLAFENCVALSNADEVDPLPLGERSSEDVPGRETSSHAWEVAECREAACDSVGLEEGPEGGEDFMDGGMGSVEVVGSYIV